MATKAVLLCILLVSLVIPHQANARELPHYSQNDEKSGKFMASHGVSKGRYIGYSHPSPYHGGCRPIYGCRGPPSTPAQPQPPPRSPYTRPCKYKYGCRPPTPP